MKPFFKNLIGFFLVSAALIFATFSNASEKKTKKPTFFDIRSLEMKHENGTIDQDKDTSFNLPVWNGKRILASTAYESFKETAHLNAKARADQVCQKLGFKQAIRFTTTQHTSNSSDLRVYEVNGKVSVQSFSPKKYFVGDYEKPVYCQSIRGYAGGSIPIYGGSYHCDNETVDIYAWFSYTVFESLTCQKSIQFSSTPITNPATIHESSSKKIEPNDQKITSQQTLTSSTDIAD